MEEALRSGIKDDTQEEIQVETSAEEKAVENFEEVAPRNGLMGGNQSVVPAWANGVLNTFFHTQILMIHFFKETEHPI